MWIPERGHLALFEQPAIKPSLTSVALGPGGDMDPALRALCMEIIDGDVDSEKFAWLLIETGINIQSFEWDVANRLLSRSDAISSITQKFGDTIH